MNRTLIAASLLLIASPAVAANVVTCWKVAPLTPCVRMVIGDTEAGLPSGSIEGVVAYAKDTDRLVCWSGSAWAPCNSGEGGGVSDGDKGDITVSGSGAVWSIDAGAVSADELDETGVEAGLEAILDLSDLQGAVTDGQVPDTITVSMAATATALAANPAPCLAGDYVTDLDADGTLTCATPAGGSGLSHAQVMTRLAVGGAY